MNEYGALGTYYDLLLEDDAAARADYMLALFSHFGNGALHTLLDLGCGSGRMTAEFARRGLEVVGVDRSEEMLALAAGRCSVFGPEVLLLCQDMCELDLNDTVEGAVCVFDGMNHLCKTAEIRQVLSRLRLFIAPGGLFVFDVNTPYKHREILADRDFILERDGVLCLWRNVRFPRTEEIEMQLDFLTEQKDGSYRRESDFVRERAYALSTWKRLLDEAGFAVRAVYGDRTEEPPGETEQRAVIVAQNLRPAEEYG